MSEITGEHNLDELSQIYAKLNKQDIEEFDAGYQWWNLRQRFVALQEQVESLQRQIAENAELMQVFHPPAISLATMARLQASGVNDLDLLDRMLERGEDWLDRTMQRLDYCEHLDFIIEDYTKWCQNALEGAYDWIDSIHEGGTGETSSSSEVPTDGIITETTEELFLQKLSSEEPATTGETLSSLEETISESHEKQLSEVSEVSEASEVSQPVEISPASAIPVEVPTSQEDIEPVLQAPQLIEISPASDTPAEVPTTQEHVENESEEPRLIEISPASDAPVETTSVADTSIEHSDQEDLSPAVPGDLIPESPPEDTSTTLEPLPAVEETANAEPASASTSATSDTKEPAFEEYVDIVPATTEPPPIEAGSTVEAEQPVVEEYNEPPTAEAEKDTASESEQLTTQDYVEVDPVPEELSRVEEYDDSDFEHHVLQEDSEHSLTAEESSTDEPPAHESLPYRMYPPDKQPGIEADAIENAEQRTRATMPRRRRNFLQRLTAKIWRG